MLNRKFKLTRYLFLAGLLFNFLVYSANSTELPVVRISSLRIELLNDRVNQINSTCWNFSKAKIKPASDTNPKRVYSESLISQNRLWKTKMTVQDIILLKVNKSICLLRTVPQKFADEHPLQFIG